MAKSDLGPVPDPGKAPETAGAARQAPEPIPDLGRVPGPARAAFQVKTRNGHLMIDALGCMPVNEHT